MKKCSRTVKKTRREKMGYTRSAILMRPSRRESCLMLSRWNWIRSDHGCAFSGSRRCLILSLQTSKARTVCGVSDISFSQRWDPMNPPAPIMHIVIGFIGLPSRSTLATDAILYDDVLGMWGIWAKWVRRGCERESRDFLGFEKKRRRI